MIAARQAPNILTLADLGTMLVKAQVSEADVINLKPGPEGTVHGVGRSDPALRRRAERHSADAGRSTTLSSIMRVSKCPTRKGCCACK
ncbi:hypothetical protein M8494_16605 [Serratia ureilytica]